MPLDQARLDAFLGQAVTELGAAMSTALALIGDRLGLYKAMSDAGPLTPADLAARTHTHERYVREWLNNQAAGGWITYDPATQRYMLPPEHALALADEQSPCFLPGAFQLIAAAFHAVPRIEEAFRTGAGLDWCDHHAMLYEGTERFFRPAYVGNLASAWIPALDGVDAKLKRGAKVADVGCGHGASTIVMAEAYPNSHFTGFDYHHLSVEAARERAKEKRLGGRVSFHMGESTDFPGADFDLVCHFDCWHDMGDPLGAARHAREVLKRDGTWMIVEPLAEDRVEQNLNPVGRMFYGASTMICVPASLAHNGPALGAQAGFSRLSELARQAGFRTFRRATTTPFNQVLEARP